MILRQQDNKGTALANTGLYLHLSAVHTDNMLHDRQSQAGTTEFPAACLVDTIESLEQPRLVTLVDTGTVIIDRYLYIVAGLGATHHHLGIGQTVLDRVVHQVNDGLGQQRTIRIDVQRCRTDEP